MKIYTDNKEGKKTLCEHKNWTELIKDGWEFVAPERFNQKVLMKRKGYMNEFWSEPK